LNRDPNPLMTRIAALQAAFGSGAFGSPETRSVLLRHALRIVAAVVILAVLAVVVLVVLVLSGPTELGFVRHRIVAALTTALGDDYEVSVGSAVLDVDPVYGLVLEVDNVAVREQGGAIVANVPSTRLDIDPIGFFAFQVDVRAIELNNAEIAIARAENGDIYLGNASSANAVARPRRERLMRGPAQDGEGSFPQLLAAFQLLDRGIEPAINRAAVAGLRRFSFNNGTIELWDAERAQRRRFPRADLAIVIDPATTALRANLTTSGYGGRWTAELERDVDASTGARTLSAVFSQLTLADILPKLGERTGRVTADIPLYGRATVRYDSEGAVEDATVRLDFGAGMFRFAEGRESVLLDEATVKLRWDVARNAIVIQPSTFFFGETRGVVAGVITPEGDPAIGRYRFNLESRGAILAPRDSTEPPLIAQRIRVSGIADLPGKLLSFDQALLQTSEGSVAAAGSLGFEGQTPSLAIAASISPMPAWAAKQMWVPFIAPGARRWFIEHVKGGQIASGTFEAAIPGGMLWTGRRQQFPEEMLRLDIRLEEMAFTTIGDLPPVANATGVAVLAGSTFGVDLESGVVKVPSGHTVTIDAGVFAIGDTSPRHPEGVIEMQLSGDAGPLGEIADAEPFSALSRQNVAPSDLSGAAHASVSVRFPVRPDVTEADVDWKVSIDGVGLACAVPLVGRMVTDADVNILVTPVDLTVRGTAMIDGVAADVDMNHPIAGGDLAGNTGQQMVRLNLDDAARKRLGIGLDEILAGSVATFVSNVESGEGQHYDLDLKRARLVLPGLGWSKGIGVPASLSFDLLPMETGYAVENLVLEGSDFGFAGRARLDSHYGITSADIRSFSLRAGDALSFELRRSKTGYAISARGESFDMRGFLKNLRDESDSGNPPDLAIEARFERLIGFNREEIRDTNISLVSAGGVTRKLAFSGKIGDSEIVASYADTGSGATMSIESPEGGRVMRFADLYTRVRGGYLRVRGNRSGSFGPLVGTLEMTNFAIFGEPAMKSVVSTASTNPGGGRTGLDPDNVRFDRLVINFAKTDQAITVSDALLGGAAIGATFNGRFDLASSTVSINGTYLPAYQFNNLFGRLPIIGLALGGGSAEGLIGVTFKIQGSTDEPRVFINPLSAVAPGIFRKIFEFQ
jgi:hypothetical protein